MLFTRSQLVIACTLASTLLLSACSKEDAAQKQDALTATEEFAFAHAFKKVTTS